MRAFLTSFREDPEGLLEYNKSFCESCDLRTDLVYNIKDDFLLVLEVIHELQDKASEKQVSCRETYAMHIYSYACVFMNRFTV